MNNIDWKEKNDEYLYYLQKFLDIAENIKNEDLKKDIIKAMLKCDEILTKLAEQQIEKMNKKG